MGKTTPFSKQIQSSNLLWIFLFCPFFGPLPEILLRNLSKIFFVQNVGSPGSFFSLGDNRTGRG